MASVHEATCSERVSSWAMNAEGQKMSGKGLGEIVEDARVKAMRMSAVSIGARSVLFMHEGEEMADDPRSIVYSVKADSKKGLQPEDMILPSKDHLLTSFYDCKVELVHREDGYSDRLLTITSSVRPMLVVESKRWLDAIGVVYTELQRSGVELDYSIAMSVEKLREGAMPEAFEYLAEAYPRFTTFVNATANRTVMLQQSANTMLGRALYCRMFVTTYQGLPAYYWLLAALRNALSLRYGKGQAFPGNTVVKREAADMLALFEIGSTESVDRFAKMQRIVEDAAQAEQEPSNDDTA